jgi:hypothetical protein
MVQVFIFDPPSNIDITIFRCIASGMYGDSYDLWLPSKALGFALNSGHIAGDNVLKYIGK